MPPIHHVGYVVDDLEAAATAMARTYGAGPFFAMEHLEFESATYLDAPATYDHSAAFGRWGHLLVELNVVHGAQPPELAAALGGPGIGPASLALDHLDPVPRRLLHGGLGVAPEGAPAPAH